MAGSLPRNMTVLDSLNCDPLDDELRELFENYKNRKNTAYEPCTEHNFVECLIGLREELGLFNLNYIFNPHVDLNDGVLHQKALVNLINAFWSLLHIHKNSMEKTETLKENNYILEQTNKKLNNMVDKLTVKVKTEFNESRACVATAQKISDRSDELLTHLTDAKAKLVHVTKQKVSMEKQLKTEISRLRADVEKLQDKFKNKPGGFFKPCTEVCNDSVSTMKETEKKQNIMITNLQASNDDLLRELIAIKEKSFIGIEDCSP